MPRRIQPPHEDQPRPVDGQAAVYSHSFIRQRQQLISDHLGLWVPQKGQHRPQAGAFIASGDNGDSEAPTACALEDLSVPV